MDNNNNNNNFKNIYNFNEQVKTGNNAMGGGIKEEVKER